MTPAFEWPSLKNIRKYRSNSPRPINNPCLEYEPFYDDGGGNNTSQFSCKIYYAQPLQLYINQL